MVGSRCTRTWQVAIFCLLQLFLGFPRFLVSFNFDLCRLSPSFSPPRPGWPTTPSSTSNSWVSPLKGFMKQTTKHLHSLFQLPTASCVDDLLHPLHLLLDALWRALPTGVISHKLNMIQNQGFKLVTNSSVFKLIFSAPSALQPPVGQEESPFPLPSWLGRPPPSCHPLLHHSNLWGGLWLSCSQIKLNHLIFFS